MGSRVKYLGERKEDERIVRLVDWKVWTCIFYCVDLAPNYHYCNFFHLKTLKFRSVFRTCSLLLFFCCVTFLLTARFLSPVLCCCCVTFLLTEPFWAHRRRISGPMTHRFYSKNPKVSHVFSHPSSAASPFCWWHVFSHPSSAAAASSFCWRSLRAVE